MICVCAVVVVISAAAYACQSTLAVSFHNESTDRAEYVLLRVYVLLVKNDGIR